MAQAPVWGRPFVLQRSAWSGFAPAAGSHLSPRVHPCLCNDWTKWWNKIRSISAEHRTTPELPRGESIGWDFVQPALQPGFSLCPILLPPPPFFSLINRLHPKLHLRVSFGESGLCQSLKATVKGSLQAPPHNLPHFLCSSFYLSILSLCLYFVLSIFRAFRFNGLLYTACPRAVRSWQKPI